VSEAQRSTDRTIAMGAADLSAYIAQVRPHNRYRGRKIFFLISRRPLLELSPEEALLYGSIDGRRSVAELERMHPGAGDTLRKWREAQIIELLPAITSPARPRLVVIEPHMDDAVLSAGGRLLHRRGQCRTTILSAVKWSNHTSYLNLKRDFLNVREVTQLRLEESALVARLLGAEFRCLNWTEAPLRLWPAERWSLATVEKFRQIPRAFTGLFPNPKEVSLLAEQLLQVLNVLAPDELWIPMGLGDHVDHRTTRNACLLMLAESRNRFSGVPVVMYEDVPYATFFGHAAQIRSGLASSGTRVVRATEDITDVFEEKLRLLSLYASQFKIPFMEPIVRGLAEREGGGEGRLAETYHRLEGEVRPPLESRLSREWAGLARLEKGVRALLPHRTESRRLAVMALPSSHLGIWRVNRESLLSAFPNADVRFYGSEDMAWQAEEGGNGKLRLDFVRGSWLGWTATNWREFFRFRTPTIVLWGGAYGFRLKDKYKKLANARARMTNLFVNAVAGLINLLIRALLPFRRVLIAKSLGDFCGVLNERLQEDRVCGGGFACRDRAD
jgi:LmbE family N-acetylglucosaminyl deacetylase